MVACQFRRLTTHTYSEFIKKKVNYFILTKCFSFIFLHKFESLVLYLLDIVFIRLCDI